MSICPHPWNHLHSGGRHGGCFGLLRLIICGQGGGNAVGRRHWEVTSETSRCGGRRRRLGYKGKKRGRIQYLAKWLCGDAVMEINTDSGVNTLQKTAKETAAVNILGSIQPHFGKTKLLRRKKELLDMDKMENNPAAHQMTFLFHTPGAAAVAPRSMDA